LFALLAVLVAGVAVTVMVVATRSAAPASRAAPVVASARPVTAFDQATRVLEDQAAALMRGDLDGWLAAVDPAKKDLVARYRAMFVNLRGLRIAYAEYLTSPGRPTRTGGVVEVQATFAYCVSVTKCPSPARPGKPAIRYTLDLTVVNGRHAITAVADDIPDPYLPPWDRAELTFATGERVIVAGSRGQAGDLDRVLAAAEKAAAIADRYAVHLKNPQERYRVLLADAKDWRRWYGGAAPDHYAYRMPLEQIGTDIVLNAAHVLGPGDDLQGEMTYQFGSLVALDGILVDRPETAWLSEGVAQYIKVDARPARTTLSALGLLDDFGGGRSPASMAPEQPGEDAGSGEWTRFEGLSHFTVDCLAGKFGSERLLTFAARVLRQGATLDKGAREVFGQPFATVDQSCVAWTRLEARKVVLGR
jgi:hypothetical protein